MISKYMRSKFNADFSEPVEFWTSVDGSLECFVAKRSEDAKNIIKKNYHFRMVDWDKCRFYDAFVYRAWAGMEFYDGGGQKRGKVWRITEDDTGMPVTVCGLYPLEEIEND